jgi:hypothetical protein
MESNKRQASGKIDVKIAGSRGKDCRANATPGRARAGTCCDVRPYVGTGREPLAPPVIQSNIASPMACCSHATFFIGIAAMGISNSILRLDELILNDAQSVRG